MSTSDPTGEFDSFFYRTYHADLKGLSARQARRHYQRYGRREARPPNPSAMLALLQVKEGALPPDFHDAGYAALNGDLGPELRHPWQAAEHYLKHGRHHGRRYRAAPAAQLTSRSSAERLHRTLAQTFPASAVSETFTAEVHKAAAAIEASATLAAPLLDAVLLARWLMSSAGSHHASFDFACLDVQLKILFQTAFRPFPIAPRSALEMEVINRVRRLAATTEVFVATPTRPPVTLLMLAAETASTGPFPREPTSDQAAALVARFFARDVARLGLERFVTAGQRAQLREPVAEAGAEPLAAVLLAEVRREEIRGGRPLTGSGSQGLQAPFLERDVWLSDMDYVMSSEQLDAAQLQVITEDGEVQLRGPGFLFHDQPGAPVDVSWAAREAAQAWLDRFISRGREDRGLPQTLVSSSAAGHAIAAPTPKARLSAGSAPGRGGRRRLRPGDLLTFGAEGAGPRHLVGKGWHGAEAAHVWSGARSALIAINLDEEDAGPLDLFLRLSPGPRPGSQVSAWWNGRLVATLRPALNAVFTLHCHLGARHCLGLQPNILCLGVDGAYRAEGDPRSLGVAVYDLMLAPR